MGHRRSRSVHRKSYCRRCQLTQTQQFGRYGQRQHEAPHFVHSQRRHHQRSVSATGHPPTATTSRNPSLATPAHSATSVSPYDQRVNRIRWVQKQFCCLPPKEEVLRRLAHRTKSHQRRQCLQAATNCRRGRHRRSQHYQRLRSPCCGAFAHPHKHTPLSPQQHPEAESSRWTQTQRQKGWTLCQLRVIPTPRCCQFRAFDLRCR